MHKEITRAYLEAVGHYGSALEYALRLSRVLWRGGEHALEAQIELADATAEHLAMLAEPGDARAFTEAHSVLVERLGGELVSTAGRLLMIQRQTHAELRALAEEGLEALSPAPVRARLPEAA